MLGQIFKCFLVDKTILPKELCNFILSQFYVFSLLIVL